LKQISSTTIYCWSSVNIKIHKY